MRDAGCGNRLGGKSFFATSRSLPASRIPHPGRVESRVPSPESRDHESPIDHADGEHCGGRMEAVLVQQLVEAIALALVVAQDDRGEAILDKATQTLDVAVDRLGRADGEDDIRPAAVAWGIALLERDRAELAEAAQDIGGLLKELVARRDILA